MPHVRTDVLITGAGPVGMLTALLLSKAGVRLKIIDQEWRTTSRTYACALHPQSLALLNRLGLGHELFAQGRRINKVLFFDGPNCQAELSLNKLTAEFPFVLVVAQSALEDLLEKTLKREHRIAVDWNHRLNEYQITGSSITAAVDKLAVSAKGFIVPEMDWEVEKSSSIEASYLIGADGPKSLVAQKLGFEFTTSTSSEFYAVYEFASDWTAENELRVAFHNNTVSVLWPLAGNRYRWSFQLREEHLKEFPVKDRQSLIIGNESLEKANRDFVSKLIAERTPWFTGQIQELGWSTDVEFSHRVMNRFGEQRCWLVGDAAHQTGPAGMQSMNAGLAEADQLAGALAKVLKESSPSDALELYNQRAIDSWRRLLRRDAVKCRPTATTWVKKHAAQLVSCIPATGEDLSRMLDQISVDLI